MNKTIRYLIYLVLFSVFSSTTTASDAFSWKPFVFSKNRSFQYHVIDHGKKLNGEFELIVYGPAPDKLSAIWHSKIGENQWAEHTVEPPRQLIERSRPVLIRWPLGPAFSSTVLSQWWEGLTEFQWQVGAKTTTSLSDLAMTMVKVIEPCSSNGLPGLKATLSFGERVLAELCVNPDVPLPLAAKLFNVNGLVQFESYLVDYHVLPTRVSSDYGLAQ